MAWAQSHLASLPADVEEKLTSASWASMPRAHRMQTSKQEKLRSLPRMQTSKGEKFTSEPSMFRRHAQTKGIGAADIEKRELASQPRLEAEEHSEAFLYINWLHFTNLTFTNALHLLISNYILETSSMGTSLACIMSEKRSTSQSSVSSSWTSACHCASGISSSSTVPRSSSTST